MTSRPELLVAKRVIRRHVLQPPVRVRDLVLDYARVEQADLPIDADAVTLYLKDPSRRPIVIVNESRPPTRRRFTLAHELGHILIPWHVGTMAISRVDGYGRFANFIYKEIEAEANRFASEILMPSDWLTDFMSNFDSVVDVHLAVSSRAEVSLTTAAITLVRSLPPGHIFAEILDEIVWFSGRSPGTRVQLYNKGTRVDPSCAFPFATYRHAIPTPSGSSIVWGVFQTETEPPQPADPRGWREVLDDILDDCGFDRTGAETKKKTINGVIGAANSIATDRTVEALYSVFRQRFSGKPDLRAIVEHDDFTTFLLKRALSLADM